MMFPALMWGQEMSVKDFRLAETDLTANTKGTIVRDQNGEVCALIKVETTLDDFSFDVGSLGVTEVRRHGGELWVYVPFGIKKITISHPKLGVIRDYVFNTRIEKGRTYILKLSTTLPKAARTYDSSKKQKMILNVTPSDATVIVNGMAMAPNSKGQYQQEYLFGVYDLLVTHPLYHTVEQEIEINNPNQPQTFNINLEHKIGEIKVTSSPSNADVYIDGKMVGTTPGTFQVNAGQRTVTVLKSGYGKEVATVNVAGSATETVDFKMNTSMKVRITSDPKWSNLYIDGVRVGSTPWEGKISMRTHELKFSEDGYKDLYVTQNFDGTRENFFYRLKYKYYNFPIIDIVGVSLVSGGNDLMLDVDAGFYIYNFYVGSDLISGLNTYSFPTIIDGDLITGEKFRPNIWSFTFGYALNTRRFRFTPQVGIARTKLQQTDEILPIKGRAVSGVAALEINFAIAKVLEVQISPQYYYTFSGDTNFRQFYVSSPEVRQWCDGFKLKVGIGLFYSNPEH